MAVLTSPKQIPKVNLVPRPKHNAAFVELTRVNNQGKRNNIQGNAQICQKKGAKYPQMKQIKSLPNMLRELSSKVPGLEHTTRLEQHGTRIRDHDPSATGTPHRTYTRAFGDVLLNHGQVTWTTPELAPPPLLTTPPHPREDVSALDRFNVHRCNTRQVFSGSGLELVTRQAMVRYLYHSATAAT
ncbi:uncharacterized protein TNCV_1667261 [Trichonephila clavipes]|nr:uncharacterized protein TNCV_1667261 [Trichonephila clavipes]